LINFQSHHPNDPKLWRTGDQEEDGFVKNRHDVLRHTIDNEVWLVWQRLPASISLQDAAPTKKQNRNATRLA
jgi:hypothetical protein